MAASATRLLHHPVRSPLVKHVREAFFSLPESRRDSVLETLTNIEDAVITLYFGSSFEARGRLEVEIAAELGLKRSKVRNIIYSAVERLVVVMRVDVEKVLA